MPARIRRSEAGRLLNHLRRYATFIASLPVVMRSADPDDDYLLALAQAAEADYLVTGDKGGLLVLQVHRATRIVTARDFLNRISR